MTIIMVDRQDVPTKKEEQDVLIEEALHLIARARDPLRGIWTPTYEAQWWRATDQWIAAITVVLSREEAVVGAVVVESDRVSATAMTEREGGSN